MHQAIQTAKHRYIYQIFLKWKKFPIQKKFYILNYAQQVNYLADVSIDSMKDMLQIWW